jgi:glutathione S-transferase
LRDFAELPSARRIFQGVIYIIPIFLAFVAYLWSHYFPNRADGQPDRVAIEKVLPEVEAHIVLLNKAVADTGHLAGSSFTYADMNLLPILAYLRECPESADMLANAKALARYFDQHSGRATVPPPFSELRP